MEEQQNVVVATYDHKYGTDIRVFKTRKSAEKWKSQIAWEYWNDEFQDETRPPETEIGDAYFEMMLDRGEESFTVHNISVED